MKKSIFIISVSFFLYACHNNSQFLKEIKTLPSYPSASAIEYYNGQFFVMGDDATQLLILDSTFNVTDSVPFFKSILTRIPKATKPDLESMTWVNVNKQPQLLLIGSGSLDTFRNKAALYDPAGKQLIFFNLDTFYFRLKANGLSELNIEGACSFNGGMILSNRGHKGSPKNHLIITSSDFWKKQSGAPITIIKVGSNKDSALFNGVSGLAYSKKTDKLFLSISTEDTKSVYEDGAIGKSYLWIIDNISSKKKWNCINPDRIIDLEYADQYFKDQKIESVCITGETKHFIQLALCADNDDGSSTLFRLDVSKK